MVSGGAGGTSAGFPCSTDGCDKFGTLVCPTCKKLGAGDVYFHDQVRAALVPRSRPRGAALSLLHYSMQLGVLARCGAWLTL